MNKLDGEILELLARQALLFKVEAFKRNLNDYRRSHSISVSDNEYYGRVLLETLISFIHANNISIPIEFNLQDPSTLVLITRGSKNDNIILRYVAFIFAHLTPNQIEFFELWNQPLDHP